MSHNSATVALGNAPVVNPLASATPSGTATSTRPSISATSGIDIGDDEDEDSESEISTPGTSVLPSSAATSLPSTNNSNVSTAIGSNSQNETTQSLSPGAIVGILIAVISVVVLLLFFLRRYFVQRRAAKVTPARSRISRLVISGPSNFQHLESGDQNTNTSGYANQHQSQTRSTVKPGESSPGWNPASTFAPPMQTELQRQEGGGSQGGVWATNQSPYDRIKQKYTVDFGNLESGLNDHVETMQGARKAAPHF